MPADRSSLSALSSPLPGEPDLSKATNEPAFTPEAAASLRRTLEEVDAVLTEGDLSTRTARVGARRR